MATAMATAQLFMCRPQARPAAQATRARDRTRESRRHEQGCASADNRDRNPIDWQQVQRARKLKLLQRRIPLKQTWYVYPGGHTVRRFHKNWRNHYGTPLASVG